MPINNKVECHADGDTCYGCDHYYGKAKVCEYADQEYKNQVERLTAEVGDIEETLDEFETLILRELREIPIHRFKLAPLGLATSAVDRARRKRDEKEQ